MTTSILEVPVLDRMPFFDRRSRDYSIRDTLPATVERKKTIWSIPDRSFPLNQGREGACVGFGWSGELSAHPHLYDTNNTYARDLYYRARAEDKRMGNNWTSGASVLAGARALKKEGRLQKYRWAFGIKDVIDTLVTTGPVVLGINWHEAMYRTRVDGLVIIDGPIVGGHCILVYGYWPGHEKFGDVVLWVNSWGLNYGIRGRAYVPVSELDQLLRAGGEACIATDVAI